MDITRSFIETAVTKALNDILRDPDRSLRNIVDLGTNFSKGRFQKLFLQSAQTMLQIEASAYYALAKRVVREVNHDTLRTFGINMGYNGFTRGAKAIRANEAALGINIPWTLSLHYREGPGHLTLAEIDATVREGKALGIYSYMLFCGEEALHAVSRLFQAHADCAFVLFLQDGAQDADSVAALAQHPNLMIALPAQAPTFASPARTLRASRCLYAAYAVYNQATVAAYMQAAWVQTMAAEGCAFALLLAGENTPPATQADIRAYVNRVREGQRYPVLLLDFASDLLAIDQAISDQSCFLSVDETGRVFAPVYGQRTAVHLRDGSLLDILSRTMPRVRRQGWTKDDLSPCES